MVFNNCSEVGFETAPDSTLSKIDSDRVLDTNDVDGLEVTPENAEEIEEILNQIAEEQSEPSIDPDALSPDGNSNSGNDDDDDSDDDDDMSAGNHDGDDDDDGSADNDDRGIASTDDDHGSCFDNARFRCPDEDQAPDSDDQNDEPQTDAADIASSKMGGMWKNFKVALCQQVDDDLASAETICLSLHEVAKTLKQEGRAGFANTYLGACEALD